MKKVIDSQETHKQSVPFMESNLTESEQIVYFKRLLVTLKSQFEEQLHVLDEQLQEQISKNHHLSQELSASCQKNKELSDLHDKELQCLREQLVNLRELTKKTRQENQTPSNKLQDFYTDNESLIEEIEKKQIYIFDLENTLEKERANYKSELEKLTEKLTFYKEQDDQHEMITSQNSSYQLRQELDFIRQTLLQGAQESKALEVRYADLFNDKMNLDYQLKSLHAELDSLSQSNNKLNANVEELTQQNHVLQILVNEKDALLIEKMDAQASLTKQVEVLDNKCLELFPIQEKYEQLKDEYIQINKQLEELMELRICAEKQLDELQVFSQEQGMHLKDKQAELESLIHEREHLLADIELLHKLVDDSETNLNTAQHHLAKKLKETTLLTEQFEEQQNNLKHFQLLVEENDSHILTLQNDLENHQKHEKKLQDQLHESLKSTEIQVAKWEQKYFEMYDKWQISENQIRELKKLEEKHIQMQNLLSNLGNYMGHSFSPNQIVQAMTSAANGDNKTTEFLFNPSVAENNKLEEVEKDNFFKINKAFSALSNNPDDS